MAFISRIPKAQMSLWELRIGDSGAEICPTTTGTG
jgi:hypothetical protein